MDKVILLVCTIIVAVDLLSNAFILAYRERWEEMKRAEIEMLRAIKGEMERRGE